MATNQSYYKPFVIILCSTITLYSFDMSRNKSNFVTQSEVVDIVNTKFKECQTNQENLHPVTHEQLIDAIDNKLQANKEETKKQIQKDDAERLKYLQAKLAQLKKEKEAVEKNEPYVRKWIAPFTFPACIVVSAIFYNQVDSYLNSENSGSENEKPKESENLSRLKKLSKLGLNTTVALTACNEISNRLFKNPIKTQNRRKKKLEEEIKKTSEKIEKMKAQNKTHAQ